MAERRTHVHWEDALDTEVNFGEKPVIQQTGWQDQRTTIGITVPLHDGRSVFFTDTLVRHIVEAYKAAGIDL